MTKKCHNCSSLVDDQAAFCDICGAPFTPGSPPASGACPTCGAQNLPGEVYCNNCGMLLPPVTVEPPKSPVANNTPPGGIPDPYSGAGPVAGAVSGRLVVSSSGYTYEFPTGKPELLIGRADPDSRFFPDIDTIPAGGDTAGVSRRHAKLTINGGRVYIEDLGSTNFTFVNRQRLQIGQRVLLNPGDEVRFGRLVMIYDA